MEILGFVGAAVVMLGVLGLLGHLVTRTDRNTGAAHGDGGFRSYDG